MAIVESIRQAQEQGASADDILNEIQNQNQGSDIYHSIDQAREMNASPDDILNEIVNQNSQQTQSIQSPVDQQPLGVFDAITGQVRSGIEKGQQSIEQGANLMSQPGIGNKLLGAGIAGLGTTAGITRALVAPISGPVEALMSRIRPGDQSQLSPQLQSLTGQITPEEQQATALQGQQLPQQVGEIAQQYPNAANLVGSALETGLNVLPGGAAEETAAKTALKDTIPSTIGTTKQVLEQAKNTFTPSPETLESGILKDYSQGVKPSIVGKNTPEKVANYNESVSGAVKSIQENSPNLKFTTDEGDVITGQTPKTIQQFADSIEQTKKSIFEQYDALAKEAGEAGGQIKAEPIASELTPIIENKALQFTHPEAVDYAKSLQDKLIKSGNFDAQTAQDIIQNYNESLKNFYRNPTYENTSRAAIDSLVANNFRKELDKTISGLTGKQYQALKTKYAQLKTIEQDVLKASLREARKVPKSLIDFTDVISGSNLVTGLLTLNPATIAHGAFSKAITEFYKHLNSPNTAVKNLFKKSEKLNYLRDSLQPINKATANTTTAKGLESANNIANNNISTNIVRSSNIPQTLRPSPNLSSKSSKPLKK